jgi:hypothetical protein
MVIGERSNGDIDKIAERFAWAKRIFFLGFGYAPENMKAIGLPYNIKLHKIFGTARNYSKKEMGEVRESLLRPNLEFTEDEYVKTVIEDNSCYSLLREYL